ncbi:Oxa1p [Sugiyamaella lignohabitans]|uniref:Oxa1p n=1 Tax=Sugiyamaella lignohabitans TaxID=796027 RepID=A0A167EVL7_9ASCO|nr:Oxa1p [Sugiyamaella lignohabitans]ANB14515.1 Oxa1p [Sugiyamaella lignohabitans]
MLLREDTLPDIGLATFETNPEPKSTVASPEPRTGEAEDDEPYGSSVLQQSVFGVRPALRQTKAFPGFAKRFNSSQVASATTSSTNGTTETVSELAASAGSAIQTEIAPIVQSASETIQAVVDTVSPDQIGYFQSVGLAQSWWWPPGMFQHIFEIVHVSTGLPWWATIAMVTVGMRAVMFPMYLKASNATAKMTALKPELNRLMKDYTNSDDPIAAQKTLMERKKLMLAHNVKTSHLLLPMASVPFFIGVFSALNGMSKVPVHGLTSEGALWFTNLAAADPYVGLQLITALFYATTFKLGGETGANTMSPAMKKIFTYMPLIAVPMTMSLPASVCMYFALNGVLSVGQTFLLQNKTFRNKVGLAPIVKPAMNPEDNLSIMETLKQSFEKTKQRAEKAQREAERELRLKKEKEAEERSKYVQFTKKPRK